MESVDVSIRLMGPLFIEVDGRPVGGFRSHKTLALLAYLIIERRPVARNYLAELLWPEATTSEGRGHLRRALHDLSQKLPGALWVDYYTAQFDPALFTHTDLAQFDALRQQGDPASLQAAAALCRGQLLEGVALDDCPIYEAWLAVERETWLRKAAGILEALQRDHIAALRFDLALGVAWQLLRLEPWRDERYQQLMTMQVRNGDLAQALAVYRRYRRDLVEGLALEPLAEIESLHERIRQARARHPGNIAPGLTPFVGRRHELATLAHDLADSACRLITLTGPGGIGKSRLAVEAAARANGPRTNLFLDGAFLVRLDTVTTPDHFLANVAQTLGMTTGAPGCVSLGMVARRIQGREMLLLLDGFDRLLPHKEMLVALLEAAPALKLLVTCQERLQLPAERVRAVKGLAVADGADGRPSEALALLLSCLHTYGRGPLSTEEWAIATHVCRLVAGMPLAIELAASWLSSGVFRTLAAELEHNLDRLASDNAYMQRHASVRAALDSTWERLRADQREALRLLAVFPYEFTAEAALRITRVGLWQLAALADKSLVEVVPGSDAGPETRYYLHVLVRQYAAEKLARHGELHARVHAAHVAYLYDQVMSRLAAPRDDNPPAVSFGVSAPRRHPGEHYLLV